MKEYEVARAIATNAKHRFHYRKMVVVPNVSWGLGFAYELDLLAVSPAGVAHEIEIKTSRADLVRDGKKRRCHGDDRIMFLWFAGPESMKLHLLELAPDRAGIVLVVEGAGNVKDGLVFLRKAKRNKHADRFSDSDTCKLARLGVMRYWARG